MDIFLIGTGTAIPVKQHSPAGLAVLADGKCLLFDIGPGSLGRLEQAGIAYDQIDQLLLTHFHPDHSLDLATLLLIFNYAPGARRKIPFTITSCAGIENFLEQMYKLYPDLVPLEYKLQLHSVFMDEFLIGKIKVRSAPTGHTPESVAYRLEVDGYSLVYSGDAAPHGGLAKLADGADLLISECSFPSGWATDDHLNADSVSQIAEQARVKSLVITHCYPPALAVDLIGQIRQQYSGEVQLGVDGLHLSLNGDT
jgi:ribonuclease BN (tRNA processing enzyme)